MINSTLQDLINKLIEKTEAKQAKWNKTSSDTKFQLALSKGVVTVHEHSSWDGPTTYGFHIYNDRGELIESTLVDDTEQSMEYDLLSELYSAARRQYYRVEETLRDIYAELNSDKPIGEDQSAAPEEDDGLPF